MHARCCCWTLTLLLLLAGRAAAEPRIDGAPDKRMTSRGSLLLDVTLGASWWNGTSATMGSKTALYALPALLYFVRDRIAVGLNAGDEVGKYHNDHGALAPWDHRVWFGLLSAFELPLGARFSLFVMPGLAYMRGWLRWVDDDASSLAWAAGGRRDAYQAVRASVAVPLVVHFSERFGIGLGPDFWGDLMLTSTRPNLEFSLAADAPEAAYPPSGAYYSGFERFPFEIGVRTTLYAAF